MGRRNSRRTGVQTGYLGPRWWRAGAAAPTSFICSMNLRRLTGTGQAPKAGSLLDTMPSNRPPRTRTSTLATRTHANLREHRARQGGAAQIAAIHCPMLAAR